jgi:hypothetical protein
LHLIPADFAISPLPSEISSFVILALQTIKLSWIQKKEEAHEKRNQVWHRWILFCSKAGLDNNPFLLDLQPPETKLVIRTFPSLYRVAAWSPQEPFLASIQATWFRQLCAMLQANWLWRFGVTFNKAPCTLREVRSYSPPSVPF